MKLSIGISPCPNDTFIFEAIYNKAFDLSPFEFNFIFEDVETLNEMASLKKLDILKMSYANFLQLGDDYLMLRSGGALGNGVGPLLIAKNNLSLEELVHTKVAIPGKQTTAHFLLKYCLPQIKNKIAYRFSEIEDAILNDEVDAGVIIHENRFTYAQKGLVKLMDLGEQWEIKTGLPIPLGGIAIRSNHTPIVQQTINQFIVNSIHWAQKKHPLISDFIKAHSQEMTDEVIRQHISLYVNDYSLDIGTKGKDAILKMASLFDIPKQNLFIH